jgi:hypothetical protein
MRQNITLAFLSDRMPAPGSCARWWHFLAPSRPCYHFVRQSTASPGTFLLMSWYQWHIRVTAATHPARCFSQCSLGCSYTSSSDLLPRVGAGGAEHGSLAAYLVLMLMPLVVRLSEQILRGARSQHARNALWFWFPLRLGGGRASRGTRREASRCERRGCAPEGARAAAAGRRPGLGEEAVTPVTTSQAKPVACRHHSTHCERFTLASAKIT